MKNNYYICVTEWSTLNSRLWRLKSLFYKPVILAITIFKFSMILYDCGITGYICSYLTIIC